MAGGREGGREGGRKKAHTQGGITEKRVRGSKCSHISST